MIIGAAVLAGGKSLRMGINKAELKLNGITMIEKILSELKSFDEIVISAESDKMYGCNAVVYSDILKNRGPAGGIYTVLSKCRSEALFVTACDMPMIKNDTVKRFCMLFDDSYDACVLKIGGMVEPLFAVYKKKTAEHFEKAIKNGSYSLKQIISDLNIKYIDISKISCNETEFLNMNTPEDYLRVVEISRENQS